MAFYYDESGTRIEGFDSKKEHEFFQKTTKRQMFFIIMFFAELIKDDDQDWVDKAQAEIKLLKRNNIQ